MNTGYDWGGWSVYMSPWTWKETMRKRSCQMRWARKIEMAEHPRGRIYKSWIAKVRGVGLKRWSVILLSLLKQPIRSRRLEMLPVRESIPREKFMKTINVFLPASLIFFSASFETNLALTITGTSGNLPLPSNFEYPLANRSMTGAVSADPDFKYFSRDSIGTSVQSYSNQILLLST